MNKRSFRERLGYWFDSRMAKGSLSLIRLLAIVSVVIVLIIALLIFILGFNEGDGFLSAFWNSLATIINAWMPYYEDGGTGYLILTAVAAVVGLLVTSILIGIIASAIEEKVNELKSGTSPVLEEDHIVVVGFCPGEYTLIKQLVLAAGDDPCCIVIASELEQEETTLYIRENVETPKNVRIICRNADIFDPAALERCSVSAARLVVVSPTDDVRTTKALLAISSVLGSGDGERTVRVCAIVSEEKHLLPASVAEAYGVSMLCSGETIAKIVAHSCTQPGLSSTFREVFAFEGSELYADTIPEAVGKRFRDVVLGMDGGIPVGLVRAGETVLNPPADTLVREDDEVLFFAESRHSVTLSAGVGEDAAPFETIPEADAETGTVAILGASETLPTILRELPENITRVIVAADGEKYKTKIDAIKNERADLEVVFCSEDLSRADALARLAGQAEHIVVLSDREQEEDPADMESIFRILNLRDIRTRRGLDFNITAEMRREYNQKLVITDDDTDFVVASNMVSLVLAQLAESPGLIGAFTELLSNRGNELYLKSAPLLACTGRKTAAELRRLALMRGYIMIGYRKADARQSFFNPPLGEVIELGGDDRLIVIGER